MSEAAVPVPPREGDGAPRSFRVRAMEGTLWTVVGYGASQVLRLAGNLVLTRLLVPEAFGLMALVNIFVLGLELLSDVGVGPAIIQSKRGDDVRLLDTAWTVQIIRGFALMAVSVLVAWPAAKAYADERLVALVAAAGVGIAVRGFTPTRVHSLNRKVVLGRLTTMELVVQACGLSVTVAIAWVTRSVWALLLGALVGDVARVGLAFLLLPGHRPALLLDRSALREIVHVGRWILLSTAVTYAVGQLDRLTLGRLLSISELGVYTIALNLVGAVLTIGRTVGSRVMFPLLAETVRAQPELLYRRLRKARALWVVPTAAVLVALAIWGDAIVALLYPAKYQDAGWMLRILAAGSLAAVLNQSMGVVWPALGEFRTITVLMLIQIPVLLAAMLVGNALRGVVGFVVGVASVELIVLPVTAALIARRRLWQPELDLPVLGGGAALALVGALLR